MTGQLTTPQIESLLQQEVIGRIGCHAHGTTYVVPTSYAYDGQYIYVRTAEGRKVDMLRTNPEVCFEVDNTQDMSNWQSVVAWGTFEELPAGEERARALLYLAGRRLPFRVSDTARLGSTWPFVGEEIDTLDGVVFRIALREKTGRYERAGASLFPR